MVENQKREKSWDPEWQTRYAGMLVSAYEAASRIRSGYRVFIGTGCATPQKLVEALTARSAELVDIEIAHLLTMGEAPYARKEIAPRMRINSFFIAQNVRALIQEGFGDYTPVFLSDIPRLFTTGKLPLDVALIQVSPPDSRGMCSFGVSVDIVKSAAENAQLVIAEINPRMPRTLGNSFINISDIDYAVAVDYPIIELPPHAMDEDSAKIGELIAALIEDNSTVEFGIGRITQAAVKFLKGKKNLGIHTEMLTDEIVELVESGVVNGTRKTLDNKKVVASFCLGTRKLYDYIDNNPAFAFHPSEYVNDVFIIAQQHKQVAVNVALEVDLTGQVCADSVGSRFYSGIGGQVDFNRGAARSIGGKAIIALNSTAQDGEISRIVPRLNPGAGVVTTRGDVHYVVTEYGVAYLHGKTVQERALALISIAHPKFRLQLVKEAVELKYLSPDFADLEADIVVGPSEFRTTFVLDDGTEIKFRAIHPTDPPLIRELFYALSEQTKYYRFMTNIRQISRKQMKDFVFINHRTDVGIVATIPEAHGEDIIAIGRYYLDEKMNMAEVAFVVRDDYQNRGIGTYLLKHLSNIARRNGIRGFTAEVLRANRAMQAVFNKSDLKVRSTLDEDKISYWMEFA